jgi:hypothetical protein
MDGELVIQILILIAAVYLAFFKSYLTEKGKSAALKEDLQELTREVESVKNEFTREQEILKTDLQRILNNEISYRNEERSALINYHGIINEWHYSILEVGFGNYNKSNVEQLIEVRQRNASFYAKAGISKSKIELLVEEKELVKAARELYVAALDFHHWTDMEFFKLQQNCESQKSLTDRFLIVIKNLEANREIAEDMAKQEEQLRTEAKTLFDNYVANRNNKYAKVIPFETTFKSHVKEYLKE